MSPLSLVFVSLGICTVTCQDLKILVGDMRPGIHQVSLRDNMATMIEGEEISRPIAIDFDADRNDLYWTDVNLHQISVMNLDTRETKLLLRSNESSVMDGIAVDASMKKIYYTDTGYDVIGTLNTDGTGHEVIIDTGLDEPRAIVLYEERRMFYWTDWGENAYIASAAYDGTHIDKIVTTDLLWPNGLALDKRNDVLYWCDGQTARIEAVNLNGRGRRLVINEPDTHYFDIFYINEALYFTDWNRRAIMSVPAQGGMVGFLNNERFKQLNGIFVMSTVGESDCQLGQYGATCEVCGYCMKNSVCDKTTGYCLAGCSTGYAGTQCLEVKDALRFKPARPSTTPPSGSCHDGPPKHNKHTDNHSRPSLHMNHVIIFGSVACVVVILLIVVIIILAVVILRRRKREISTPNNDGGCATEEVKQPPLYSVAADLPPAYSSVTKP